MSVLYSLPGTVGFGRDGKPWFWLRQGRGARPGPRGLYQPRPRHRGCLPRRCLGAGARDNGGPGVREIYHPQYYGAFVLDPDGHNVEAVCHAPSG